MWLYFLLGPLLFLMATVFKLFPPKGINPVYGYRSRRSMASDLVWNAANTYSSRLFILISLLLNLIQIIVFLVFTTEVAFLVMGLNITVGVLLIIPLTESYLKKNFPTHL